MRDHRVAASSEVEPTRESPEATTRNPSSPAAEPTADLEESMTRAKGESDERPYAREQENKGAGKGAHGRARAIFIIRKRVLSPPGSPTCHPVFRVNYPRQLFPPRVNYPGPSVEVEIRRG